VTNAFSTSSTVAEGRFMRHCGFGIFVAVGWSKCQPNAVIVGCFERISQGDAFIVSALRIQFR